VFAVIDCGTTNTRIFIVSEKKEIVASGTRQIGVRDTSITGSKDALKNGLEELYFSILKENNIPAGDIDFAIASGMITSEIGLIEIPHLVAPVGMEELSGNIKMVNDPEVLNIGVPVYFVRGVRNDYGTDAGIGDLRQVDFLRGEEVQCIGILYELKPELPLNVVILSSHTKIVHLDQQGRIARCMSTISGQLFNAMRDATSVGKSLVPVEGEEAESGDFEKIVETARDCVENAGFIRTMLMPRFMQVLLKTSGNERILFTNAAIAADDIKAFQEFKNQGFGTKNYILFGHESRCHLYSYLINREFGADCKIQSIYDNDRIAYLTVKGAISVALSLRDTTNNF
jgi:2-dehydro-3-deoxygalactonokinase